MTRKMSWRKLGDDGKDLCCSLDYLLDGIQTLRSSIQSGRRLCGEGEIKVDLKELWCSGLYRDRAEDSTHPTLEDAKIALRRMKDAKSLLSCISKSLDDAIQSVTDDTSNDCRAAGLSLLPDDLLTNIFEIYVEMSVSSEESFYYNMSPQILASVSKRFRQVALAHSGIWKHVFLRFSRECVLMYKERCSNPVIHIDTASQLSPVEMEKFHIHPYQQWRGLRAAYNDRNEGHIYFQHWKAIIQTPLDALEEFMLSNNNSTAINAFGGRTPLSIHLDGDDLDTLLSWRMPNLTRLDLRNVLPLAPLSCGKITSFSFHASLYDQRENLNMTAFRSLLQSMPMIQSLHIALLNIMETSGNLSSNPLSLPDLKSLKLEIGGYTSDEVVGRMLKLLVLEELTRLELKLYPFDHRRQHVIDHWVFTIFDDRLYIPFVNLEVFSLEVERFRGSVEAFHQMFSVMPSVHTVSLLLPRDTEFSFAKITKKNGVLQKLRSLRIALPDTHPDDFTKHLYYLDEFFGDGHCKELVRVEIEFQRTDYATSAKARLQKTLGEKLYMIEQ
ncbi:hypothetical protein SCHPADRAFT_1001793 [Schizopora paradoxa]|uniref:F-box domain-containing protein n=1 Tax=Schizopora paradoxa TaxID=27342 RepID=A0A0H2RCN8_9AGAM|nr:hypothetical protein SCHPADRAFT_1001793 [Schizopora paradoxa]